MGTKFASTENQLPCCGSGGVGAIGGRARSGTRDDGPLASSPTAVVLPLDLLDLRCRDLELVVGDPGGFVMPGREGTTENGEGAALARFASGSFAPPPDERARFGAAEVLCMTPARWAASMACWWAAAAAAAVAAEVGIEDGTPADIDRLGEDFFCVGELRERADLGFARDLGVVGSADDVLLGAPREPVIVAEWCRGHVFDGAILFEQQTDFQKNHPHEEAEVVQVEGAVKLGRDGVQTYLEF